MHDRRNNVRLLCADLVQIRWKDASGKIRKTVANLEDISSNGACLQTESDVPTRTVISITHPKGELVGTVKYCEYREFGYFLGLEFQEGGKWFMQDFRPQHLLDPRRLVDRKQDDGAQNNENFCVLPSIHLAL
jgi:hypothetical protein